MASIMLSTVGGLVGAAVAGPLGGAIGMALGGALGSAVDSSLFGRPPHKHSEGARLPSLAIQQSAYGIPIPDIYGTMRIAGNILWMRPIKETVQTEHHSTDVGKGGQTIEHSHTHYHYSATLAIGLCQGPIRGIGCLWADAKKIPFSELQGRLRLYHGTEDQLPDSLIEASEGIGKTPAYRGLAYIVLEDFPLGPFGNRIPNFTVEVERHVSLDRPEAESVESMVRSMVIIPGSGEFVYDTQPCYQLPGTKHRGRWYPGGKRTPINQHSVDRRCDSLLSLDQLQQTCPRLEWVAPVVCWFATSLDIGACEIHPGVEFQEGAFTEPENWHVAGRSRDQGHLIRRDPTGKPQYGGTPSDNSIIRYLSALKKRGLRRLFYPMLQVDVPGKPWRGHLSGAAAHIHGFFNRLAGYRNFILHYARLVKDLVDGFVIGSEMVGLTTIRDGASFPAVDALRQLAQEVKSILGPEAIVTYAADWSEYHHSEGGWYHLDPLWADNAIDVVGIDAYFPLTHQAQADITERSIIEGWQSGEGYDYYYADSARTTQQPLDKAYAWKNMRWWWEEYHHNPTGEVTPWAPRMKPIWFTEYGFPSVDGASNEPNRFVDPTCRDGGFPRLSQQHIDVHAQRQAIRATERYWRDSDMVQRRFLWCWDARPFPYYPYMKECWSDGDRWAYGHWVNGKFGQSMLGAVIAHLCQKAGIGLHAIDSSAVMDRAVEGFAITEALSFHDAIAQLQCAYGFDIIERNGQLVCVTRYDPPRIALEAHHLCASDDADRPAIVIERDEAASLPSLCEIALVNRFRDYQPHLYRAMHDRLPLVHWQAALPILGSESFGNALAMRHLRRYWSEAQRYYIRAMPALMTLRPGDRLYWQDEGGRAHDIRLTDVTIESNYEVALRGLSHDNAVYVPSYHGMADNQGIASDAHDPALQLYCCELPRAYTGGKFLLHFALCSKGMAWNGALLTADFLGTQGHYLGQAPYQATMGRCLTLLPPHPAPRIDRTTRLLVSMQQGELHSIEDEAWWNGENRLLIGTEIICFRYARWKGNGLYELHHLIRGCYGTEWATAGHEENETVIGLNKALYSVELPSSSLQRSAAIRATAPSAPASDSAHATHTIQGTGIFPLLPVQGHMACDSDGMLHIEWTNRSEELHDWNKASPQKEPAEYRIRLYCHTTLWHEGQARGCAYRLAISDASIRAQQASITCYLTPASPATGPHYRIPMTG